MAKTRERMNIVIVGHVDHGKSTLVGRLMADTGSLPKGKLEQVKGSCKRNSKVFEYAFLLDALKDEQSQGITIDSARCFFKTKKRDYIIIDTPGHIEFLKNMVSGASRAEAALLVIDANEGIKENSKRHAYMLSMLGIGQVIVCANKMDLVGYKKPAFAEIVKEYSKFLSRIGIKPACFIPLSAGKGENIINRSKMMPWHKGKTILEAIESLKKAALPEKDIFRMPVQDIYKFTNFGDNRRLIAGRVESGTIKIGDAVRFYPSGKASRIKTIETFNGPKKTEVSAGHSTAFTLKEQVYIKPGEIMCGRSESPGSGSKFRANVFWMGKKPLVPGKEYKLKLATSKAFAKIQAFEKVIDASTLEASTTKQQADRHDVAECVIETSKPIAFDEISRCQATGRFVLVDNYEIAGGGIVTEALNDKGPDINERVDLREVKWVRSEIPQSARATKFKHKPNLILITGKRGVNKIDIAKHLESMLFEKGYAVYYLGIRSLIYGVDSDIKSAEPFRDEHIRRLAEVAHILLDAGLTVITTASDLHEDDIDKIRIILSDQKIFTIIVGENYFTEDAADVVVDSEPSVAKTAKYISDLYARGKRIQ